MQEAGYPILREYVLTAGLGCKADINAPCVAEIAGATTAIFSSNYYMTMGLMRGVAEVRPCPRKVSILSFDDFVMGDDGFKLGDDVLPRTDRRGST